MDEMSEEDSGLYIELAYDWLEKLADYKVQHPHISLREIVTVVRDMLDDPHVQKEYLD
jgi:hypothetical protein